MGKKEDSIYNLFLELRTPILKNDNGSWLDQLNDIHVDKIDLLVNKLNKYFELIRAFNAMSQDVARSKELKIMINELEREQYGERLISRIVAIYQEGKPECPVATKKNKSATDIESMLRACGVNIQIGEIKKMHAEIKNKEIKLPTASGISIPLAFDSVVKEKFVNPEYKFPKSILNNQDSRKAFLQNKQYFLAVFDEPLPPFNTNRLSVNECQQWFKLLTQFEASVQKERKEIEQEKSKIWFFRFRRKKSWRDWERIVCAKQKELAVVHLEMLEYLNKSAANLDEAVKADMLEKVIDCQLPSLVLLRNIFVADKLLDERYKNIFSVIKGNYYPEGAPKEQDVRAMWKLSQRKATDVDILLLAYWFGLQNSSVQKFNIEERYGIYYVPAREALFSWAENFFNCPSGNVSVEDNNSLVLLAFLIESDKRSESREKLLESLNKLKACADAHYRSHIFFKYFGELMNQLLSGRCPHYKNVLQKTGGSLSSHNIQTNADVVKPTKEVYVSIPVPMPVNHEFSNNSKRGNSYAKS